MPVNAGGDILASQYNSLRTVINNVLNINYGQSLLSTVASGNTEISSDKKRELFLDIQRTQVHHTALLNNNIAIPPAGVTVAADTSQNYNQGTGVLSPVADGEKMGYNDYETAVNILADFTPSTINIWPPGNFTLGTATSSSRSAGWGGNSQAQSIYHILTFTFQNETIRNQYFNAGGELRFSASLTGGSGDKDTDWTNLLNSIGTIRFSKWRSTADSGTVNPLGSGYDSLSGTYRILFTKTGSGLYASNQYTLEARIESSTVLRFRITLNDADTGSGDPNFPEIPGIDESVGGTTTSTVNTFRPNSSFTFNSQPITAVSLPAPTVVTVVELSSDNFSPPN
jgi:hypothetical protein